MTKNFDDPTQEKMYANHPCPHCKEDDVDNLIWDDPENIDGAVTCITCGTRYHPHHPEIVPQKPN